MKATRIVSALTVALWMLGIAAAVPPSARAAGAINLYADPNYSQCVLYEQVGVPNSIYIVHELAPDANTSQFMVRDTWGVPHTGQDYGSNLHLGDAYTGVTVTYTGCRALPYLVCTLSVTPLTPSGECPGQLGYAMEVVADPHLPSGQIEVVECDGLTIGYASGGKLGVNDQTGICSCIWDPISTEATTWSKVKAMYR